MEAKGNRAHYIDGVSEPYDLTPDVEQTLIDEGYFDLTANRREPPAEIALTIRKAIG